jgi:hypothetical protein
MSIRGGGKAGSGGGGGGGAGAAAPQEGGARAPRGPGSEGVVLLAVEGSGEGGPVEEKKGASSGAASPAVPRVRVTAESTGGFAAPVSPPLPGRSLRPAAGNRH